MNEPPLFVLGAPRSGTTLLASLLKSTRWGTAVESHFITKYYKRLQRFGDLNNFDSFARIINRISRERPVMQWRIDINAEALFESLPEHSYAEICNQVCMLRASLSGKQSWADKTPHYIRDLPILETLFPTAKHIHIVRDGRDVALSLLQQPWGPNNVYACAKYWAQCHELTATVTQMQEEKRLYEVRYEDLLGDPAHNVQAIYEFLQQPVPADLHDMCARVKRNNHDKWKTSMSPYDQGVFEAAAGSTLRHYGYPLAHRSASVPALARGAYVVSDRMKWLRHLVKTNTVDSVKIRFLGKEPFAE